MFDLESDVVGFCKGEKQRYLSIQRKLNSWFLWKTLNFAKIVQSTFANICRIKLTMIRSPRQIIIKSTLIVRSCNTKEKYDVHPLHRHKH